jgi:hypothetical protein
MGLHGLLQGVLYLTYPALVRGYLFDYLQTAILTLLLYTGQIQTQLSKTRVKKKPWLISSPLSQNFTPFSLLLHQYFLVAKILLEYNGTSIFTLHAYCLFQCHVRESSEMQICTADH